VNEGKTVKVSSFSLRSIRISRRRTANSDGVAGLIYVSKGVLEDRVVDSLLAGGSASRVIDSISSIFRVEASRVFNSFCVIAIRLLCFKIATICPGHSVRILVLEDRA
jgi:hypothetical protein